MAFTQLMPRLNRLRWLEKIPGGPGFEPRLGVTIAISKQNESRGADENRLLATCNHFSSSAHVELVRRDDVDVPSSEIPAGPSNHIEKV